MSEKGYTIVQLVLASCLLGCSTVSLVGAIVVHGFQTWQFANLTFVVLSGLMMKWAVEEYKEAKNKD